MRMDRRMFQASDFLTFASIVSLIAISAPCVAYGADSSRDILIDPISLPSEFNNDKLLLHEEPEQSDALFCPPLIGCYKEIPIFAIRNQDPMTIGTEFSVFTRKSPNNNESIKIGINEYCFNDGACQNHPFDITELRASSFDPDKRTIVLIGGYLSSSLTDWCLKIKDLWLEIADANVIIVGWPHGNHLTYGEASRNVRAVARQVVVLFYYLAHLHMLSLDDKAFTSNVYVIGHSLGAHIAGFIGRDLGGKLGRITGLDPAGPHFDGLSKDFRLDRTDAQLVDALHTNAGDQLLPLNTSYGSSLASGHIDLYANDGKHQSSCSVDALGCSHGKATSYYSAFLEHEIAMRKLQKDDRLGTKLYRLRAYSSGSYDQFRSSLGFKEKCPLSLTDDNYSMRDLNKCSVPVDYVSRSEEFRDELEKDYSIDFEREVNETYGNRFYFYSIHDNDEQSDHYLLKIKLKKSGWRDEFSTQLSSIECSFTAKVEYEDSSSFIKSFDSYKPIDENDHYDILFPFQSPNLASKIELVKWDLDDFSVKGTKEGALSGIREHASKTMPKSVSLSGIGPYSVRACHLKKKKNSGYVSQLYNYVKDKLWSTQKTETRTEEIDPRCRLPIGSITVRPLRRLHRHVVAAYSIYNSGPMKVLVFTNKNSTDNSIEIDLNYSSSEVVTQARQSTGQNNYLGTISVGPYDSSADPQVTEAPFDPTIESRKEVIRKKFILKPPSIAATTISPEKPSASQVDLTQLTTQSQISEPLEPGTYQLTLQNPWPIAIVSSLISILLTSLIIFSALHFLKYKREDGRSLLAYLEDQTSIPLSERDKGRPNR